MEGNSKHHLLLYDKIQLNLRLCMKWSEVKVTQLCPTVFDPMDCSLLGSSIHGNSPGKNTGVGCHDFLQGIFPTQGLNPGLRHCRRILYQQSHKGSPRILERVAAPFSRGSSWPRNWTGISCIAGRFFTNWAIREALAPFGWYHIAPRMAVVCKVSYIPTFSPRVVIVVQSLSCLTLRDPMDCSMPGFPVLHHLPGLAQTHVHPTIWSSVIPISSCLQSFPASGSFPMSQFFISSGQSIGASGSASVLPMNIQDWFPLGLTVLISLQSKGLSRVFSNTTVQKHQFFGTQLSL